MVSVGRFLERAAQDYLSLDNRFLRTLRLLLTRPGQLSADYVQGRRARHTAPFRLYLVISTVYFASLAITETEMILPTVRIGGADAELFRRALPYLMFVLVPFFALLLGALYRGLLFVEHLVFSLHYHSFAFLTIVAMAWLQQAFEVGRLDGPGYVAVSLLGLALQLVPIAYLYAALRRFYGQGGWKTLGKVFLLLIGAGLLLGSLTTLTLVVLA